MIDFETMFMAMRRSGVPMLMTVLVIDWWIVLVIMMAIVMAMGVFMFEFIVFVQMTMPLGEMQKDGRREEKRSNDGVRPARSLTERPSNASTDERRDGEDPSGAPCPDHPLRPQMEPQAEAIASQSAKQEREHVAST